MRKCFFFLLFIAIMHQYVTGQIIVTGKVLDAGSGSGITAASIHLTDLKGKTYPIIQTDKSGHFQVSAPDTGTYSLHISAGNYAQAKLSIFLAKDTTLTDIRLSKQYDLGEVTINGAQVKISRKFDKVTVDLYNTVLTSAGTAFDLLQKMPSVILQQDGTVMLQSKIATVMIDGRPLNLSGNDLKTYLNGLPAGSISKVELIRNPSAMHDAQDATIINLVTNKSLKAGWNGNISVGMTQGHYSRYYPSIDFNYRHKKINLYGAYSYTHVKELTSTSSSRPLSADLNQVLDIETRATLSNKTQNLKLGLDYTISKNSLMGVVLYGSSNRLSQDLTSNTRFTHAQLQDSLIRLATLSHVKAFSPSVNLYYKLVTDTTRHSELTLNLDYWHYNRKPEQYFNNSFYDNLDNPYRDNLILKSNTSGLNNIYSLKADYIHPLKKGRLLFGLKTYLTKRDNHFIWQNFANDKWQIDDNITNQFLYNENINALYSGYENTWKKISLQLMLRAEHTNIHGKSVTIDQQFSKHYIDLFPSLNLEYNLSAKNQFNLSYRRSISRPAYNNLDPFRQFQDQYNYTQGNSRLLPAISGALELGHSYNNILFTTLSYTWSKNVISMLYLQDPENNALTTTYDNLSATKSCELDVAANLAITKRWTSSISTVLTYNYVNTLFREAPVKNEGWGFNLFLFNNLLLPKNFSASMVMAYSAPYNGTIFQYSASGFINIGINKTLLHNRASVNLAVNDQLTHVSFQNKTNYNNLRYEQRIFRDNRTITLTLRYKLGNLKIKQSSNRKTGIESEKSRMDNK
ncbi:outer membrane beta-barrel protein [Chitinophaga sancti]|uniref:outer membrane beta-barrel protein n=1 Tax=Chitinophaga sancti TaxID=1004 RepID=UPI003F79B73A